MKNLMWSLLIVGCFALVDGGCTASQAAKGFQVSAAIAPDLLECGPREYGEVRDAISNGGPSWIGAVIGAFQCVGTVLKDLRSAGLIADTDPSGAALARPLSRGAHRRAVAAQVLSDVIRAGRSR